MSVQEHQSHTCTLLYLNRKKNLSLKNRFLFVPDFYTTSADSEENVRGTNPLNVEETIDTSLHNEDC